MLNVVKGYRGLRLLWSLNWDRLFALAVIFAALFLGAALIPVLSGQ
jgi:hypothetical protein